MSTKNRQQFLDRLAILVPDPKLTPARQQACLELAIEDFSKVIPDQGTDTQTGDSSTQAWDVPDDWQEDWSSIISIEYPSGENPAEYLEDEEYELYYDAENAVFKYRLTEDTPSASESLVMTFRKLHIVSDETNTIQDTYFATFCEIMAMHACKILAAVYAPSGDSTINADSVQHTSKSGNYTKLAKDFEKSWNQKLGVSGGVAGSGIVFDMDMASGVDKGDLVFHGRKLR